MALNIKNPQVEKLAKEIAGITGETKTEAIKRALEERRDRLSFQIAPRDRHADLLRFLEYEIWAVIPEARLGKKWSKKKEAALLGYGPMGV